MKKDIIMKKVIKTITRDIAKYLLSLKIDENDTEITFVDKELFIVEKRDADIIAECKINEEDVILHLEIQSSYDSTMSRRMLRYYNEIKMLYKKKKIYQYLIYTGERNVTMKDNIKDDNLDFKFNVINMKDIDCNKLIKFDNPNALVLAILCDFKDKDKLKTVMSMIDKLLEYTKGDDVKFNNYLLMMETLTDNMEINKILVKAEHNMLSEMTIEKTVSYQVGIEKGIERGIERGRENGLEQGKRDRNIEIARNLLDVLDIDIIALKTGLTEKEIKGLK